MSRQNFAGLGLSFLYKVANFPVNQLSGSIGNIFALSDGVTEKNFFIICFVQQRPEFIAHTPLSNHLSCQPCGLLNIVRRPSGDLFRAEN